MTQPKKIVAKGHGAIQMRPVFIPPLDAIIGNPPYVEQTSIRNSKKGNGIEKGTKEYYQNLVQRESGIKLNGRSDLHCYFWPHATTFLKPDGYLCLLTSSQWLDVDYGFRLQEWILDNFEIIAIFESVDEPWFIGARVLTAATILRKQTDKVKRDGNLVRFIQLRKPLADVIAYDGTSAGMLNAVNSFREEILAIRAPVVTSNYRVRIISQKDLWQDGVTLGKALTDKEGYYGGKWGVHLRAPDVWFKLMEKTGKNWRPLGILAKSVVYGIKSGADDFFYVRDVTEELGIAGEDDLFANGRRYSLAKLRKRDIRIVACGDGEYGVIESKYLQPEIHSMMEVERYSVSSSDCSRMILLVGKSKDELNGTYVLDYIKWGESKGYHQNISCSSRVTENREWYDLTGHEPAPLLWAKQHQYRHSAPVNSELLAANCGIYEIQPPKELNDPNLWAGILNSTWVLLSALQYGRPVGNEGSWSTMVAEVKMMLVPTPIGKSAHLHSRLISIFKRMKDRSAVQFLSERRMRTYAYNSAGRDRELIGLSSNTEFDMPDRRELDDAVLEMLGVSSPKERNSLIDELYESLREHYEATRLKEEKAIENKAKSKKRSLTRPADIATQIYHEIKKDAPNFLRRLDPDFLNPNMAIDAIEIPELGNPRLSGDMFTKYAVEFGNGKRRTGAVAARNFAQAELIVLLAQYDERGIMHLPVSEEDCRNLMVEYEDYLERRVRLVKERIEERTADDVLQEKIFHILMPLIKQR